jgi:transposase
VQDEETDQSVSINCFAALDEDGLVVAKGYNEKGNSDTLMHFTDTYLLPKMNKYPDKRSVIVLDNAPIHHAGQDLFARYCNSHSVMGEFIPHYSPNLNPIEECFSAVKAHCRRDYRALLNSPSIVNDIECVFKLVATKANCTGWVKDSGYYDLLRN